MVCTVRWHAVRHSPVHVKHMLGRLTLCFSLPQEDPKAAKKAAKKAKRARRSFRRKKAIKDEGLPEEDGLVSGKQTAGASALTCCCGRKLFHGAYSTQVCF